MIETAALQITIRCTGAAGNVQLEIDVVHCRPVNGNVICPVDPPKYKRRTFDEAMAIAMKRFDAEARQHLNFEQYEYCLTKACLGGGSIDPAWTDRLGYKPEERLHYEVSIHDWAESELPGSPPPKCWVRILVSRDRSSDFCEIWWLPEAKQPGR